MTRAEYKRSWRAKNRAKRIVEDRLERLRRKKAGICYSCNQPVERDSTGKAKSYCSKHMEYRRLQDRRRWHRMNGHIKQLPKDHSVVQEFLKENK